MRDVAIVILPAICGLESLRGRHCGSVSALVGQNTKVIVIEGYGVLMHQRSSIPCCCSGGISDAFCLGAFAIDMCMLSLLKMRCATSKIQLRALNFVLGAVSAKR